MKLKSAITAALLLLTARESAAQCTSSDGQTANYATVRLVLNNPSSMPAAIQQGITDGVGAWNASSCNDGNDFPVFFTSGGADATIQVFFDPNLSQALDGNGNTYCAIFSAPADGSSGTLTLYERTRLASGQTYDCYPNSAIAADSAAHELGHYLGLADSGCSGYIMAGRSGSFVNGQIVWNTSREVQGAECTFADSTNSTNAEQQNENSDPYCDAYCWTECIGSYCPEGAPSCPILIDMENDGIHLTGLDDPVWFDIDADGAPNLMSWTDQSEGLLALDRNGNGTIDNGGELFGNATLLANGSRALNGYLALAELNSWAFGGNGDDAISAADEAFSFLRMWTDFNHDGISQAEELLTLEEAGIPRIDLDYKRSNRSDRYGNEFRFLGRAWIEGRHGVVRPVVTWDVFFLIAP